ncbi:unnamed protein product [Clonostachys rosea f. rosea IK726]|uniref:Uncharacterized protein n=2 Tax=Clonostachys rosea f. rosea IK726 TaxID=1349383 RepID=A0ACA9UCY7_BIOOC|nr:unnamed protein product [Clonostachys rosea f. rosea IK726]
MPQPVPLQAVLEIHPSRATVETDLFIKVAQACEKDLELLDNLYNDCRAFIHLQRGISDQSSRLIDDVRKGLNEVYGAVDLYLGIDSMGKYVLQKTPDGIVESIGFRTQTSIVGQYHASVLSELYRLRQLASSGHDISNNGVNTGRNIPTFDNVDLLAEIIGNTSLRSRQTNDVDNRSPVELGDCHYDPKICPIGETNGGPIDRDKVRGAGKPGQQNLAELCGDTRVPGFPPHVAELGGDYELPKPPLQNANAAAPFATPLSEEKQVLSGQRAHAASGTEICLDPVRLAAKMRKEDELKRVVINSNDTSGLSLLFG